MSTFPRDTPNTPQPSGPASIVPTEVVGPVAGGLIIALAVSGLVDDSGLLTHPWWAVLLASLAAVGFLLGARTVKTLLQSPGA